MVNKVINGYYYVYNFIWTTCMCIFLYTENDVATTSEEYINLAQAGAGLNKYIVIFILIVFWIFFFTTKKPLISSILSTSLFLVIRTYRYGFQTNLLTTIGICMGISLVLHIYLKLTLHEKAPSALELDVKNKRTSK